MNYCINHIGSILSKLMCLVIILTFSRMPMVAQNYRPFNVNVYTSASTGFYFLCPIRIGPNPSAIKPTHMIIDAKGKVVYYKEFLSAGNTGDFKLQPNGLISYSRAGKFYLMDSTFFIVDSVSIKNGIAPDLHDLQILSNGHYLLLGTEQVIMNLSSYNLFNHNGSPGSANANVKCGVIQELDQNKNVVFEWHSKNYYSFADVDSSFLNGINNVDWTHYNAVELDQDGNILVCSRHFNEITKINRSDSSIIWRLGGNQNQFMFTNDPQKFHGQHDIRRLANGNITLFDNGYGAATIPYHAAKAKEYQLNEGLKTATLVWSFEDDAACYSTAMGNAQRVSNGNTVLCYGLSSKGNKIFNAVDASGQKVFEIEFIDSLVSYRAFNYVNLPWNLKRPVITCFNNAGQYYLDAGAGYASYNWSNGATTQTIPITSADTFFVFVPIGSGGFISSEEFIVSNLLNPCNNTGISYDDALEKIKIFPNPASESFILNLNDNKDSEITVKIFSELGVLMKTIKTNDPAMSPIFIHELPQGIYFVEVEGKRLKLIKSN